MKKDKEDNDKDDDKEDDDKDDDNNQATNVSTYDETNISYDRNMSCDGETPNHSNSNSTWIFLRVIVTVATYFFSPTTTYRESL